MSFRASVLTLYPEMFPGPLGASLAGRALEEGIWRLETKNIRDFAADKHRSVDDTPAGGGAGMVLRPDVLAAALDSVADGRPMLALTPRGAPFTQARVRELAGGEGAILLSGRFEGFDERIFDARFFRMWEYYLAGGIVMFESGAACNYQVQYIRDRRALPIARDYMAEAEARYREIAAEIAPAKRAPQRRSAPKRVGRNTAR